MYSFDNCLSSNNPCCQFSESAVSSRSYSTEKK